MVPNISWSSCEFFSRSISRKPTIPEPYDQLNLRFNQLISTACFLRFACFCYFTTMPSSTVLLPRSLSHVEIPHLNDFLKFDASMFTTLPTLQIVLCHISSISLAFVVVFPSFVVITAFCKALKLFSYKSYPTFLLPRATFQKEG